MPMVENGCGPRRMPPSYRKTDDFRSEGADGFDALNLGVKGGGGFEFEIDGGLVALGAEGNETAVAAGGEKAFDGGGFFGVSLVGAALIARGEAHFHLGVDTAGMGGVGIEVVAAAAKQEELEGFIGKALGGGAGGKRAVSPVGFTLAGAVGDGDAGIGVGAEEANEGGRAEVHAV
jgi:hypothetical protein